MTQYRITTNSGKFRIEHFVEKKWYNPHSGWYPLILPMTWFESEEEAEKMLQALMLRDAMNNKPWEPT